MCHAKFVVGKINLLFILIPLMVLFSEKKERTCDLFLQKILIRDVITIVLLKSNFVLITAI